MTTRVVNGITEQWCAKGTKCGIYGIFNRITAKVYVGASKDVGRRWILHRHMLAHGKSKTGRLQKDWDVYGRNAFVFIILEECAENELLPRERFWYDFLSPAYNTRRPHPSGITAESIRKRQLGAKNRIVTPELRKRLSKAAKRQFANPENREKDSKAHRGKTHSPETRAKLSAATSRNMTPDRRKQISDSLKGRKNGPLSAETRRKLSESHKGKPSPNKGKKANPETAAKIAAALKGKKRGPMSPEQKAKISATQKARKANR